MNTTNQFVFRSLRIRITSLVTVVVAAVVLSSMSTAQAAKWPIDSAIKVVSDDGFISALDYENRSFVVPNQLVQNDARTAPSNLRSRSEVVREVKRQYNAEVLKITLNQQGSAYIVRILMPNGRVRQITVSARR